MVVVALARSEGPESLWHAIWTGSWVWVDLVLLVLLGLLNVGAWVTIDMSKAQVGEPNESSERLRTASAGAVAAVGFLLPLTVLAVQTRATNGTPVPHLALADFYLAECWLAVSLALGTFVLAMTAFRGYQASILKSRPIAIVFGFELIFLLVGVIRFVFAVTSLTSSLLQS